MIPREQAVKLRAELEAFEQSRAGVAEMLSKLAGDSLGEALDEARSALEQPGELLDAQLPR